MKGTEKGSWRHFGFSLILAFFTDIAFERKETITVYSMPSISYHRILVLTNIPLILIDPPTCATMSPFQRRRPVKGQRTGLDKKALGPHSTVLSWRFHARLLRRSSPAWSTRTLQPKPFRCAAKRAIFFSKKCVDLQRRPTLTSKRCFVRIEAQTFDWEVSQSFTTWSAFPIHHRI